ncbi:MAG: carbohydrate-binding family 9-like protein [Calditrichae bacterium]|nr:carbohydrate-binding family 9-like protein [Calditrichia bacterium]
MVDFKKFLLKPLMLAALLLAFAACERTEEPAAPDYQIIAAPTEAVMTVDGLLDEPAWQSAQTVTLAENRTGTAVSDSAVLTRVKTCYNPTTLFIAFICNDPDIWTTFTQRDEHLLGRRGGGGVSRYRPGTVYLRGDRGLPANVLFDSYIVDPVHIDVPATKQYDLSAIQTAVAVEGTLNRRDDRDRRWTVEIAIPLAEVIRTRRGWCPARPPGGSTSTASTPTAAENPPATPGRPPARGFISRRCLGWCGLVGDRCWLSVHNKISWVTY